MKKTLLCAALLTAFAAAPSLSMAQASWNIGATTDYRYRGVSQSRLKPAIQGGFDFATESGFYVGTWLSTIKWIRDAGAGGSNIEWDIYGGYKGEFSKGGLGYDVGALAYVYPGNKYGSVYFVNANTTELYGALTFGPVTAKYSHAITNLFGFALPGVKSRGSGYFDVTGTFDLGNGWSVAPHIGYQKVKNFKTASYTDYSLTVSKDFSGLVVSAALVGTDAGKVGGVPVYPSPTGKDLAKNGFVLSVKKTF
jgi:uncharacterized protein (TIGR02001 family)